MKVFISWSGSSSRALAEALADWFPKVIQCVEPFVSAKDIDKGANWGTELVRALGDAEFGIICLAPDNLQSPWLNYEAGAIAKSIDSRACPVLLNVSKSDVLPPISQLQMTEIEIEDFKILMTSMNKAAGHPLEALALLESIETWWPKLEARVAAIEAPESRPEIAVTGEPDQPEATVEEMLAELLHRVRKMDVRLGLVERSGRVRNSSVQKLGDLNKDELRSAIIKLLVELGDASLSPDNLKVRHNCLDVLFDEPLPNPLPSEAYSAVGEVAKRVGAEVRLVGPDRTVTFDQSGFPDEPPF